ncbi:MAG: hypothetical protein JSV18_05825 [Candidatus Bathyarchaeota archaeon]|nr:MAG: hypothetical protein JSV18_05825 [Candidatus Bathyarchaeota archaeon]
MSERNSIWMWAAAALLCTTIASSYLALNYQSRYAQLETDYQILLTDVEELTIVINLKIDYGADEVVWFNNTRMPLDASLLRATQMLVEVEYSSGELGAFVTEINDVGGDPNTYWIWYHYDQDTGTWMYGPTGSDAWTLHNGDIVAWVYSSF